jgi:hypothetical protein
MKELVSTIQSLLVKVEEGNISQVEMEQLVADARELNERLIVLRYKVYEQGIFEIQPTVNQEPEVDLPEIELNLEITDNSQEVDLNEAVEIKNVEGFDEEHALSEVLNSMLDDFSKEELEEIIPPSPVSSETKVENPSDSDLFSSETPTDEPSIELSFEDEPENDEQIIEESTSIRSTFNEETNSETQEITHHQTSVIETEQSTTIIETEETTSITVVEHATEESESVMSNESIENASSIGAAGAVTSGNTDIESKLKSIEQSLRINYSIVPLETLIGSFTLNERLQFINELFEGSSDSFSSAVKKMDVLDGLDSARSVVAEFASTNNWDLESEIVEDFLVKICRRYA